MAWKCSASTKHLFIHSSYVVNHVTGTIGEIWSARMFFIFLFFQGGAGNVGGPIAQHSSHL
jgi:hypothetical protein